MPPVSAVIITKNEARNIGRCLASLAGVVDEMLVVDSFSTDATLEICAEHGAKVLQKDWMGYSATKNWANEQAANPIILSLDADEALSPGLRESILAVKSDFSGVAGFNRLTNYCGKWIKHSGWYPDRKPRLFHRNQARWVGEFVHETLQTDAGIEVKWLKGDLFHYSYYTLSEHFARANKYSDLAAEAMVKNGKSGLLWKSMVNPVFRFWKHFLFKAGFLDGYYGLVISVISAMEVFMKYSKAWTLQRKKS